MCTLRQKPAEPACWAIIWSLQLVKISRDVEHAIVSLSPSHDSVSWLIQSRLACFPTGRKDFFFPLKDSYLTVTMAAAILNTKGEAPSPTDSPVGLFLVLECA